MQTKVKYSFQLGWANKNELCKVKKYVLKNHTKNVDVYNPLRENKICGKKYDLIVLH